MILTFFDKFTIAKPSCSKNSKNSFNLTEVFLKKNKIWSILFFCNKEIKMCYKLKQLFKLEKQKSCFPQLDYVNWRHHLHIWRFWIFVYSLCRFLLITTHWSIALDVSLACVLHWMCQLFNGITGNHSFWTLLKLGGQTFSEKFSLSCSLSLFMAVAFIICRCNL